jgi:hypothetical protein
MLSRVHYQRPDRIHVENVSPGRRRIIADGHTLFYHEDGSAKGFARAIADLDKDWLVRLRTVPGTPMEHLLWLTGLPEITLDPVPGCPLRRGYQAEKAYVVLSCDERGRLAAIEWFTTSERNRKTAECRYRDFQEVAPGCWIPRLHQSVLWLDDGRTEETRRVDNLVVNQPVAPALFNARAFFPAVAFEPEFKVGP